MQFKRPEGEAKLVETDFGSGEISEAVNAIHRHYESVMKEAWEKAPETDGQSVAKAGLSMAVGYIAYGLYLTDGAPEEIRGMVDEMVKEIVAQMIAQDKAKPPKPPSA